MATQFKKYIEQPTSSITINANDTYNVTNVAKVIVNVPNPSTGEITIGRQFSNDVTNYATAKVKNGYVSTPATTEVQSTPTFSQNGNVITANVAQKTLKITPQVTTEGWITQSNASEGTITLGSSSDTFTIPSGSASITTKTQQQSKPTFSQTGNVVTATVAAQSGLTINGTKTAGYVDNTAISGTLNLTSNSDSYTIPTGSITLNAPTVDSSGLITSSATVGTAGYIDTAPSSATTQLSTQAATTITPKITSQTAVESNKYTTGVVSVNPIYEEIDTVAGMEAINVDANIGKMYKFTGTSSSGYYNEGLYIVEELIATFDKFTIPTTATSLEFILQEV